MTQLPPPIPPPHRNTKQLALLCQVAGSGTNIELHLRQTRTELNLWNSTIRQTFQHRQVHFESWNYVTMCCVRAPCTWASSRQLGLSICKGYPRLTVHSSQCHNISGACLNKIRVKNGQKLSRMITNSCLGHILDLVRVHAHQSFHRDPGDV